jgi:hypothetical protein
VAPFLNRERDFLQGLGTLVQSHAEEIKAMVMAQRARADATQADETAGPEVRVDAGETPGDPVSSRSSAEGSSAMLEPASSREIRTRLGFEPPESVSVPDEPADGGEGPAAEEPVVVESATEPVHRTEGSPASDRPERSLRELFWGEE